MPARSSFPIIRSIPACAGEPSPSSLPPGARRVYPRVCGGTRPARGVRSPSSGLSPRVRGNPFPIIFAAARGGSIPACAGEPLDGSGCSTSPEVYPRVCGGTFPIILAARRAEGLSPRVRGNQDDGERTPRRQGSIPACAGEPSPSSLPPGARRVYPRVCGGTLGPGKPDLDDDGLSPRVRGNRRNLVCRCYRFGSIPACAGEPYCAISMLALQWVYPRVCGGTAASRL